VGKKFVTFQTKPQCNLLLGGTAERNQTVYSRPPVSVSSKKRNFPSVRFFYHMVND
jgi:hypothetical protein